jgi:hypothetical protein
MLKTGHAIGLAGTHEKRLMTELGVGRFGGDLLLVVDLNNELMDCAFL